MARAKGKGFTPGRAKNLVGLAKVLAPALIPVVAPVAARAAALLGDRYDRYRASRLGVPVDQLTLYSGRGAGLHARIVGVGEALRQVGDTEPSYVEDTERRLSQLLAAVRASERMPAARRRAAHRAVAADLDAVEAALLKRLGV
ncbi:DUF6474 family protein [Saccharothrix sp. HUAS TT1]|uniref:DUF6474 family protein n=1 Tax=unclassified Saccharothrix TaxID=2593673 RepID=UPI00345B824A